MVKDKRVIRVKEGIKNSRVYNIVNLFAKGADKLSCYPHSAPEFGILIINAKLCFLQQILVKIEGQTAKMTSQTTLETLL